MLFWFKKKKSLFPGHKISTACTAHKITNFHFLFNKTDSIAAFRLFLSHKKKNKIRVTFYTRTSIISPSLVNSDMLDVASKRSLAVAINILNPFIAWWCWFTSCDIKHKNTSNKNKNRNRKKRKKNIKILKTFHHSLLRKMFSTNSSSSPQGNLKLTANASFSFVLHFKIKHTNTFERKEKKTVCDMTLTTKSSVKWQNENQLVVFVFHLIRFSYTVSI